MHDLPAKNQWTGTRTITAAGNRTCIIALRLSDFKSQARLTLLLRHYELTNENSSYFLTNQSKTKTFIDLKVTRKPKQTKNSTRPYLNEIPYEIKTKGYNVIGVNLFFRKLMRFLSKKRPNRCVLYYFDDTRLYVSGNVNFLSSSFVQAMSWWLGALQMASCATLTRLKLFYSRL